MIVLVRHGQASWGAADYDLLSPLGEVQSGTVGTALAGLTPDVVVHGSLTRQRQTAELALKASGWSCPVECDPDWDEMDADALLAATQRPFEGEPDPAQFQQWFEAATDRWTAGVHDHEYDESYPMFRNRVLAALRRLGQGRDAVVFTSGGPIAVVVTELLEAGVVTHTRLAPVVVNTSVTRVLNGRRGLTLLTFNEHTHLPLDQLTYR
ncbi:histidine phosphatase family protein [Nocardioides sp.]|uniref:histidine phosphatase family protein n=1 Tax=Nocardioides sp. TaxID=35761 RepID=UPI003D0ACF61